MQQRIPKTLISTRRCKSLIKKTGFCGHKSETATVHRRSKLRGIAFKKKTTDLSRLCYLSLSGILARQEAREAHEPRDILA
ncbi:MAG: hypothetical protein M0Q43_07760 [Methanothrix sp.]|jgi:hypothetical protein|nr:hypothetical protein [Methanothrix sp.]